MYSKDYQENKLQNQDQDLTINSMQEPKIPYNNANELKRIKIELKRLRKDKLMPKPKLLSLSSILAPRKRFSLLNNV